MQISTDETGERPGRRPAGRDPAKRNQILDGAKRCFLELGFEAASMNDITSSAGVSKGTLYVYFKDKEDLFKELIDREKAAVTGAARAELEKPGTIAERLTRFGISVTTRLTSVEIIRAQRMVLGIADRMPDIATRFFGGDAFSANQTLAEWLDTQVAAGLLEIDDTNLAGCQFLDLCSSSIYKRRLFGNLPEPVPAAEIARVTAHAVDMFMSYYGRR